MEEKTTAQLPSLMISLKPPKSVAYELERNLLHHFCLLLRSINQQNISVNTQTCSPSNQGYPKQGSVLRPVLYADDLPTTRDACCDDMAILVVSTHAQGPHYSICSDAAMSRWKKCLTIKRRKVKNNATRSVHATFTTLHLKRWSS